MTTTLTAAQISTDLKNINKSSIKFCSWAVRITDGYSFPYSYKEKKTGATVTVHKYECRLVGGTETAYVTAVFKGNKKAVTEAKQKLKMGSIWILSNIKFEEKKEGPYISSPLKISVDLNKSTLAPAEDADLEKQVAKVSVPLRTVAETANITSTRNQDLMGIVTDVSDVRQTKSGDVMDATIMDASQDSAGVYIKVLVSVFGSSKHRLVTIGKALVFFNLACKVEGDSKQYTHWENALLCEAPPCDKHTKLTEDFDKLKNAANTNMLTNYTPTHSIDVSGPQQIGTTAFLDYTAQNPDANMPEVSQIMLATIEEPTGSVTIVNADNSERIWFTTNVREFSGMAQVGIPEKIALQLTGLDREGFIAAHAANKLQFPLLWNLRVRRTISKGTGAFESSLTKGTGAFNSSGASQPDAKTFVNHTIQIRN